MGSLNAISYDSPKLLPIRVYSTDMKNHYKRPLPPDVGWDDLRPNFRSFNGTSIKTWNIDGCFEGQMMIIFQKMFVATTSYLRRMNQREIVDALTVGFTGNLRSWWHNHLTDANREAIKEVVIEKTKQGPNSDVITIQPNSVNTLFYVAIRHFVGRTTLYNDQSMEALLGMKCPKMIDFKWYKDTFMSRLYNLTTCRDVVWKHKYVEGRPKYVRERLYSTMITNGGGTERDWEGISYGDINSTIQKVIKAEEISSEEEEFSSEQEEDLLNGILEDSSEEPSSFEVS
ncbi:Enzymatic polyprotein [Cucumis melo var. makuwa]|uniref:Enzymatic polyprotein n=1 Tax=Cucumis melo var. makuwa TaxID=1194695 RepID=A0A5D3DCW6_CUCMM|nr:Enzymatic polyprotein [Cucumis melo var. makuwa]TYK21424.1 Enzymatic polyprotein [Cucumis melo var. makuwa]